MTKKKTSINRRARFPSTIGLVAGDGARPSTAPSASEEKFLAAVQRSVDQTKRLFAWWRELDAAGGYRERIEIEGDRPGDRGFLFFDETDLGEGRERIIGSSFEFGYTPDIAEICTRALEDFVYGRFLNIGVSRPALETGKAEPGFVYTQHYYERRRDGALGKFGPEERSAIGDLRNLAESYEWVLLEVEIRGDLRLEPFGKAGFGLELPLKNRQWIVLVPELLTDRDSGEATHGLGYGLFRDPDHRSLLAYGPGKLELGFQLFRFSRRATGELRARLIFVTKGLERVFDSKLDPFRILLWLVRFFGLAERHGISQRRFEENMLLFHCKKHREVVRAYLAELGLPTVDRHRASLHSDRRYRTIGVG